VKGTILEKKEEPQESTTLSQKVKELEEELVEYKNKFNQLKALLDG
jgi:phage shock protein A